MNAGDRYGPYHIVQLIGRGAMGDVYLANNLQAKRAVALKIVNKVSDREVLDAERLGAELQKRLRGSDSRVVAVNTYGEITGDLFIEMEFVEGEDVSSLIKRGPVNPNFAAHIARELCEMLENLRAFTTTIGSQRFVGVVHGDLKPGNVRVDKKNHVKVLDFGIAKALTHTRKYTVNVFASTAYCSPERIETQNMDAQSDLWSVGVLLYQMIAGRLPFDEPTKEQLERRIRSAQLPDPLPSSCPPPLQSIIYKMLARDAALRYQTPFEASQDLARFQQGQPVMAGEILPISSFDHDATVRTSAPAPDPLATQRTSIPHTADQRTIRSTPTSSTVRSIPVSSIPVRSIPVRSIPVRSIPVRPTPVSAPLFRGSSYRNKVFGCLLAPTIVCLIIVTYCAVQWNFWNAADRFKADLQAERIVNLDQAWADYQTLNKRTHLSVLLWGAERALKSRLVTAADETISEYRNSDAPSVSKMQWVEARKNLARALELSPGDNGLKGRLRLCEAHVDRIDLTVQRGSARQKTLNAAVNKFYEAADLMKHSPDPYLGLANVYIYGMGDVDKAEDALKNATHRGYHLGNRETAQLADGYRRRADRLWRQSRGFTQMSDQERDYLDKARQDYLHAEDLYSHASLFGNTPQNKLLAIQSERKVEQRLYQLQTNGITQ